MIGDCITCAKLGLCTETSPQKLLASFTCPLYTPVVQPVYEARWHMIQRYGETTAANAMIDRPLHTDEGKEEDDCST